MKIEKVNDHQIRCTLTKADLAERELKISELAYGTEKAKNLFRDMMQQAAIKFGFEADDIPLMIEAIPLNADCIVLIITKVEDPEELDTRFAKFAPSEEDAAEDIEPEDFIPADQAGTDSIFDLFRQIQESRKVELASGSKAASQTGPGHSASAQSKTSAPTPAAESENDAAALNAVRVFHFDTLHILIRLSHVVKGFYNGSNSLYQIPSSGTFSLVLREENSSPEDFNRICNVVSEYGRLERSASSSEAYFTEHAQLIYADNALQILGSL